jgi:CheY-like chemotaxis protein
MVADTQAEEPSGLVILTDGRPGMNLHRKREYANGIASLLEEGGTPTRSHALQASSQPAPGLDAQLRAWHAQHPGRLRDRALLIVSDLMEPAPFGPSAVRLAREAAELTVIQLVAATEVRPPDEPRRLRDVNTGDRVTAPASGDRYREAFARHTHACAAWVQGQGGRFVQLVVDDTPVGRRGLLTRLQHTGLVTAARGR